MDILTTVVFLLDKLDIKNDVKKKLHNKGCIIFSVCNV